MDIEMVRVNSPAGEPTPDEERIDVESEHLIPANDSMERALQILDDRNWTNVEEFINPWGLQKVTIVHLAAYRGNLEVLKRASALRADLSATDIFRRSALHYAADQGHAEVIKWLLKPSVAEEEQSQLGNSSQLQLPRPPSAHEDESLGTDRSTFDVQDEDGRTPLHAAADGGHLECIRILIKEGLSVASRTRSGVTVIKTIFEQVPDPIAFLTEILDEQVSGMDKSCKKVILDFQVLTPSAEYPKQIATNFTDLNVVFALINAVPNMEQMAILQHPLLATFINRKFVLAIPLNLIMLFLHVISIICASWLAICTKSIDEGCIKTIVFIPLITYLGCCFLDSLWISSVTAEHRFCSLLEKSLMYLSMIFSTLNTFFWCLFIRFTSLFSLRDDPLSITLTEFRVVMAMVILYDCLYMITVLWQFPLLGEYAYMFACILSKTVKSLLTCVPIIIIFALSFMLLFSDADQFKTPWKALAKTLAMMVGEYEYDVLFPPTGENNSTINNSTSDNTLLISGISVTVFLSFVMLTSIGLMNFMVGLVVSDIHELLKESRSHRLMYQAFSTVRWIGLGVFTSRILGYHPECLTKTTSRTLELDVTSSSWIPWHGIPANIKQALHDLAVKNSIRNKKAQTDPPNCDSEEDNPADIRSLLQRIVDEQQLQKDQIGRLTEHLDIIRSQTDSPCDSTQDMLTAIQSLLQKIAVEQQRQNHQTQRLTQDRQTKWHRKTI